MRKLPYENFLKAHDFIHANGDDVTRAWFQYNFEDGDSVAFMKVLETHQREDGGFGGLLYEFDYQASRWTPTPMSRGRCRRRPPRGWAVSWPSKRYKKSSKRKRKYRDQRPVLPQNSAFGSGFGSCPEPSPDPNRFPLEKLRKRLKSYWI